MVTMRGSERARDQILRRSSLGSWGKRGNVVGGEGDIAAVRDLRFGALFLELFRVLGDIDLGELENDLFVTWSYCGFYIVVIDVEEVKLEVGFQVPSCLPGPAYRMPHQSRGLTAKGAKDLATESGFDARKPSIIGL
jgi:hypothetical protein